MKARCKIFGHKYRYSIISGQTPRVIRVCDRCGFAAEWRRGYTDMVWMWLVQYTKKGAKEWAEKNNVAL